MIDPEVLLQILLLGYLYGIPSERKLVEALRMHLAWRWFTGTLLAVRAVLASVALLACGVPLFRATRIDPQVVLRNE